MVGGFSDKTAGAGRRAKRDESVGGVGRAALNREPHQATKRPAPDKWTCLKLREWSCPGTEAKRPRT